MQSIEHTLRALDRVAADQQQQLLEGPLGLGVIVGEGYSKPLLKDACFTC